MAGVEQLLKTDRPFLTDGGLETWLFFQRGFQAPEFAAIVLLDDELARQAMRHYFDGFLALAESSMTGFVLDTNTWRGCSHWGPKLNRSKADMLRLSRDAVAFAREIRDAWRTRVSPIIINGVIGPAGDGYAPGRVPDPTEARETHRPQIETLAQAGVDMISAITMTNSGEAIGIAEVAAEVQLPAVISFTVETDGRLPIGQPLGDAIQLVDAVTNGWPCYYMVNCAHPDHFRKIFASGQDWISRIGGIRANASRLSHAELDIAEKLDEGNPVEFGQLYADLVDLLPNLRVVGGCCGTDHRHVRSVSQNLHVQNAA
ncbi:MAG: hypothetical protein RLZ98_1971 [Pseudomonadota bacterium]|jgi:homocysteine S-methyltransferase